MNVYYATIELRQKYDVGCNTKKQKQKQNKTKTKQKQKQQQKKKKKHNECSHASSASNVHAFSTLYDGRNEKGQTCKGLSSQRPKNTQDKVLKDKKVIDKMKNGQNKKSKTVRGQKACRAMW